MTKEKPEKTAGLPVIRGPRGRFLPGTSPGPGRPKGSKNKPKPDPHPELIPFTDEWFKQVLDELDLSGDIDPPMARLDPRPPPDHIEE